MHDNLIQKYNIPGPRYTSYPTVPYWDETSISPIIWKDTAVRAFEESNSDEGISVYIHLPYCESLCTFCGCHKRITKRHSVEVPYIEAVLNEWKSYRELFDTTPRIKELHLGGGTPTFFSPDHLQRLLEGILEHAEVAEGNEYGFEAHPNSTTRQHLETLYELGFRRCSFGVQDYDPLVQKTINRIQSFAASNPGKRNRYDQQDKPAGAGSAGILQLCARALDKRYRSTWVQRSGPAKK
jgi:oxygen-independent coproporphyrinogen-3 oxidase